MMYSTKTSKFSGASVWMGDNSARVSEGQANQVNGYNFERMLDLVARTKKDVKYFYDHFRAGTRRQSVVDVKKMRGLLADLYREKVRLQKHLWELRVQYSEGIPLKKKQKIQNYQHVIDACIADIEKILRQV